MIFNLKLLSDIYSMIWDDLIHINDFNIWLIKWDTDSIKYDDINQMEKLNETEKWLIVESNHD